MKTLAQLEGADFLRRCYDLAEKLEHLLTLTGVGDVMKRKAKLTGKETETEKQAKNKAQFNANLKEAFRILCVEYPEETDAFIDQLVYPDKGEKLSGMEKLMAATTVIFQPKTVDFLSSLLTLA